ncbi:hypothetical protein CEXT_629931 [Caerostris extrusa]|uniref:Uncharacterized protein n=1 Tax=Caerostris extrusa TaxID=172846 RepID=A0AAV4P968_CAEEX|nr:hypothetical protein CEXT_629931 [Caerostris extrusa]
MHTLSPSFSPKRNQGGSPGTKSRHSHKDTESQKSSHHSGERKRHHRRKKDAEAGLAAEVEEERSRATCVVVAISTTIIVIAVLLVVVTLYFTPHFQDYDKGESYICSNITNSNLLQQSYNYSNLLHFTPFNTDELVTVGLYFLSNTW